MTPENLKIYAQIQACVAKMEGLKSENAYLAIHDEYPVYREQDFDEIACEIKELSNQIQTGG